MKIDIIIVSNAKDACFEAMTQQAIYTCHESEEDIKFNCVVYEQNTDVIYDKAFTIHYDFPFHYNKIMNDGITATHHPYVCMCNNDLIFHKGWATRILEEMGSKVLSASPNHFRCEDEPKVISGYDIGNGGQIKGWCIFTNRKLYSMIGKIDESVSFWYSDHVYADQLKRQNIEHILVRDSYVEHLGSKTIHSEDNVVKNILCGDQEKIYNEISNNNFGQYHKL